MLNKQYTNMLQEKDVIFEIFQYATERAKVVGADLALVTLLYLHLLL